MQPLEIRSCNSDQPLLSTRFGTASGHVNGSRQSNAGDPAATIVLSDQSRRKLAFYTEKLPYTSPSSYLKCTTRMSATHPEHADLMPTNHIGMCWGGSALRQGSSRHIQSALNDREKALALVADAYLLAKRQRTECLLWTLSKTCLFPLHTMPLEGALNARQTKNLMQKVLGENGVNTDTLKKIRFRKMNLDSTAERTPIRHGLNAGSSVLPMNTPKTRAQLYKAFPPETHPALGDLLRNPDNYVDRTIQTNSIAPLERATLSEAGWHRIVQLALAG